MNSKLSVRKIEKHEIQILDCDGELKDNENWMSAETSRVRSFLIYARALLEYVIIIMWLRSVIKMLRSVKFAEDNVLTFLILREKMLK